MIFVFFPWLPTWAHFISLLGPEHRRWEALLKLVRFFLLLLFRLFEGLFEGFNMLKKLGNFAEN